ncbi:hypothetical protein GY45DRAFT_1375336 [Cubamyces sp. BRFM 1775]|nr:hypothetical protein GY45DRAFT_1375336 [Cubamyces sp. BRFM 1775]
MSAPFLHLLGFPSLDTTLGSIYLGTTIGVMLYGLTVHQAYRYYKHFPNDGWLYPKGIVTTVLAFETIHTMLWMYIGYRYMVSEAFNLPGILSSHWTISSTFLVTSFSVFTCQVFYTCRIWKFGVAYYRWFLIPAILSMIAGLAFAIVASAKAFLIVEKITDLDKISWMVSAAYGCSVGSDIMLAGIFVFTLLRIRGEHKVRSTNSLLNTLIIYTINTGMLTSIISFMAFLFALLIHGNLIYAGVSIVGAKLYANSVLALLNSRKYLNNLLQDDFTSVNLGETDSDTPASSPPQTRRAAPPKRGGPRQGPAIRSEMSVMSDVNFAVPPTIDEDGLEMEEVRGEQAV